MKDPLTTKIRGLQIPMRKAKRTTDPILKILKTLFRKIRMKAPLSRRTKGKANRRIRTISMMSSLTKTERIRLPMKNPQRRKYLKIRKQKIQKQKTQKQKTRMMNCSPILYLRIR